MLTQARLRSLLDYDPNTGLFTWRARTGTRGVAGATAGTLSRGYIFIQIDGHRYIAHRLVWLYVNGVWPPEQIDHINMIRNDNNLANLRLATSKENQGNKPRQKNNTSGFKGVTWHKPTGCWRAQISINYKIVTIGRFKTPQAAHAAYIAAAKKHFGNFSRAA